MGRGSTAGFLRFTARQAPSRTTHSQYDIKGRSMRGARAPQPVLSTATFLKIYLVNMDFSAKTKREHQCLCKFRKSGLVL